ncbi:hypothetical protein [Sporosalibacterium faouarense]|uniref:hypothetical protein n=1 Tax=Sporosalibacterium faouarense TaxID=516123 RepID=UPI00192AC305|nr:hypothetical protein [Sporosalibacterium faouarense]
MTTKNKFDLTNNTEIDTSELKKLILEINENQLNNIGQMAILESIMMEIDLKKIYNKNIDLINNQGEDGEKIVKLYKKIRNKDLDISLVINSNEMSKELGYGYFKNLRAGCQDLLSSISGYVTEISYLNEIASETLHKDDIKRGYVDVVENIDMDKFYQNVYKFLTEDMDSLSYRAMEVVSVIPMRISRNKYYDIIKTAIIKGLRSSSKEEVSILLDRYKTIFNGTMEEDYGQRFDYYFRKTHELKKFDFKDSSLDNLLELHNDTTEILTEIDRIVDVIRKIGLILNRYIVINLLKKRLTKLDEDILDILKLWDSCDEENNKLEEEIFDKCKDRIKSIEEDFGEDNLKLQEIITEFYKRESQMDEESNNQLLKTQRVLSYMNDMSLEKEELLFQNQIEVVDDNYLDQAVDNFIEFVDRNIKGMPNILRKTRMRRLLCLIEFPFKQPDEFFNYLRNSIESSSKEDLIANINLVAEVIAKYRTSK